MNKSGTRYNRGRYAVRRCVTILLLLVWYTVAQPPPAWDEEISTDTVLITSIDSFITAGDTGSSAKRIDCPLGPVRMSHIMHKGTACKTCHHRNDNNDRIKQCARCHKGVEGLERMHRQCGQCHQARMMDTECGSCHDLDKNVKVSRMHPPELLYVKFSHINHHARKDDCRYCHKGLKKADWLKTENYPPMNTCLTCHDNRKSSGACSVCHDDVTSIKPRTHNHTWIGRYGHGLDANHDRETCMPCHDKQGDCDRCHAGRTSYRIHAPGYRYTHGMDVRRGQVNCGMCHAAKNFCSQCHEARR